MYIFCKVLSLNNLEIQPFIIIWFIFNFYYIIFHLLLNSLSAPTTLYAADQNPNSSVIGF